MTKEMPTLINQRHETDCVIASIAMWMRLPYDTIIEQAVMLDIDPSEKGMPDNHTDELLRAFGVFPAWMRYMGGLEGLLALPSLNNLYGSHICYVYDYQILDPQDGKLDKEFYPSESKNFPPHFRTCINLNDEYSRDLYETSLKMQAGVMADWLKENS